MKKCQIRKTTINDIEQTIKLGNAVWRSAYAHIFPQHIFDEKDAMVKEKIKQAKEIGVNIFGRVDYVAVDNDKVVAFVVGKLDSGYDHYSGYADLMALYIDSKYQHLGLGKKLFNEVVKYFKKNNCKKMVIGVLKDNKQARSAYEKWGGRLDNYEMPFTRSGFTTSEVFYVYNLNELKDN